MSRVYNQWSPVYFRSYRERIAPGFFDGRWGRTCEPCSSHDANFLLSRTRSNTLALASDEFGLRASIEVSNASTIQDLVVAPMRRGISRVPRSPSTCQSKAAQPEAGEDGVNERTLVRCETLWDVGPVTFPFYPQTDRLALRSLESWLQERETPAPEFSRENRQRRAALVSALALDSVSAAVVVSADRLGDVGAAVLKRAGARGRNIATSPR
jgi:HK97 family phage prohead protease